jgi:hypothetical protein
MERERYTSNKCMLCHTKLVNRQPLKSMSPSKYKKGNFLCGTCRLNCKNGLVKCQDCSHIARNFILLNDDEDYLYLGKSTVVDK